MEGTNQFLHRDGGPSTLRDFVSFGFRHRRQIVLSFLGIFLGAILIGLLLPTYFVARIEILLSPERLDPTMSINSNQKPSTSTSIVTEQIINSEVELLRSQDLLEKVVVVTGLNQIAENASWWSNLVRPSLGSKDSSGQTSDKDMMTSLMAMVLSKNLIIQPILKSNIIAVTYKDSNPQQAARVLNSYADLYLEKHLVVHRPPGAMDFFKKESSRYRQELTDIEAQLSNFGRAEGLVSPQLEKEITLQRFDEREAKLGETNAAIAERVERMRALEAQLASTAPRITSTVRTSDNRNVVQNLKSTLATLKLKRTELVAKYKPSFRGVQEIDTQIAQIQEALAEESKVSLREEVTAQDPTYQKLKEELAIVRSELPGLQARAAKESQYVSAYRTKGRQLYQQELVQANLIRAQKTAEENYALYFRKQEEARISDELDKQRILNVTLLQKASVPVVPSSPSLLIIFVFAGLLASVVSLGMAFALEYLDTSFRTPQELQAFLNIPVAAAIPKS